MTIRAYELALRHFFLCLERLAGANERADLTDLVVPRQVIPGHRGRMEVIPAVRTWRCGLDLVVPLLQPLTMLFDLAPSPQSVANPPLTVVLPDAVLAPML
jgi:hypothetical protein